MGVRIERDARPPVEWADRLVLAELTLRDGENLQSTSRFGDDVWDLTPAVHQAHQSSCKLYFQTLPVAFREVAKELFFAFLAGPLLPGQSRAGIGRVRSHFTQVKTFLEWIDSRGVQLLADVTTTDMDAFNVFVVSKDISDTSRRAVRTAARAFWIYRHQLATDQLTFDPYTLEGWTKAGRKNKGMENMTDRIPPEVIGPLLVWSLWLIDEVGPDLIAARREWRPLFMVIARPSSQQRLGQTWSGPGFLGDGATWSQGFQALLDWYRAEGRPLPGNGRGGVNRKFLDRQVGRGRHGWSPRETHWLENAVAELGVADDAYLTTPVTGTLDGRPWTTQIRYSDVPVLAIMARTACYVVIAYLSGMRDSEIKHLRRGCTSRRMDSDGNVVRRLITSLAFKGESSPAGVTATWVISEPVERAVQLLEQLQEPDIDYLITPLPGSVGYNYAKYGQFALTNTSTLESFKKLCRWINDYCDEHGRTDGIPLVRGKVWMLNTSQFRRTLAWFIARQPGGSIAGAIQYRHHSIQMFEGYAGTSDSGFRAEVEAEQAIERGDHLRAMIECHGHEDLAGPSADEARRRIADFERKVSFGGTVVTDRKRMALIMKRDDPKIYFGEFVACVYNPETALCRKRTSGKAGTTPDLADCKPLRCRNVALTAANIAALRQHFAHVQQQLSRRAVLAPYLFDRLQRQHDELTQFLRCTDDGPTS